MLASCWVARKIFLSPASASSKARTLDSLPTTNGVIMNGKITTSRMGIIGSFLVSNFSRWVTGTTLWLGAFSLREKVVVVLALSARFSLLGILTTRLGY